MKIINFNPLQFNNERVNFNTTRANLKMSSLISKDTVSFGQRTYDNTDPNIQLYRGVGATEIQALCEGKTIEGTSYTTSNPKGYRGRNWASGGGYGEYFITFNKTKVKFSDHRDDDMDTRYMVEPYNIADVETIRKGQNNHGELIYSMDFENDKKNDILVKQQDIRDTLVKLQSGQLSKEEKDVCFDNLRSYSKEFPQLDEAIKIANMPLGHKLLKIKEKYIMPSVEATENKELMALVKSMTPQKVEEFGAIRDIKNHHRLINRRLDFVTDEAYSRYDWTDIIKELKIEIEQLKARFETLIELGNQNRVVDFEIKSLQQILHRCKTAFRLEI